MTAQQEFDLDFGLAFERVRDELRERPKTFRALAHNPFELDLIEFDLTEWLSKLEERVQESGYIPGGIDACDYPKGSNLVRPGSRLAVADRVVFTAAVGACIDQIDNATRWSQGGCDLACRLDPARLHGRRWFRNPFKGWSEFRTRSLQRLDSPTYSVVLTADIAGFFENINIGLLKSDLARIGCPAPAIELIGTCLNQWSQCPDRGLPQGMLASDLLAKLYLEPFDKRLREASVTHLRYTDDIRVFAKNVDEARRALVTVTRILRKRGLTLQSSKTRIRSADEARAEIDGITPAIEKIQRGYVDEVIAAGLMAGDVSLPMAAIDDLVGDGEIDAEVLRRAFTAFVVERKSPNKSMLNYLLRRLGAQGDNFAVSECAKRLATNPEFTPSMAFYFQELDSPDELEAKIVDALRDETGAIYPYQRYLLLDWWARNASTLTDDALAIVRQLATRPESPQYVRAVAFQILGLFGTHADLDVIEDGYKSATDPLVRAQLLCCLRRLEKSRRNGLAARVRNDDGALGWAAAWVMQ